MASNAPLSFPPKLDRKQIGLLLLLLSAILLMLFFPSFRADQTLFSNDGPLGAQSAKANLLPDTFTGSWQDLNWIGAHGGSALPSVTFGILAILKPIGFSKFYGPLTLLICGIAAYVLFRQLRFNPAVCLLGAIATTLNMDIFSNVCWGLGTRAITFASVFLALAALSSAATRQTWVKYALAGLCVGMGLTEGADVGVIFSLVVAAYTMMLSYTQEAQPGRGLAKGVGRTALVAFFAAFMAFQAINALVHAKVMSSVQSQQDSKSPEENWDWATQWSLPKIETLRVAIPGLFGYRMDTPDGGQYWGTVGQQPGWPSHHQGFPRYSGSGEYAGVAVVLIALWGLAASFSSSSNAFSAPEKKLIWFWAAMAFLSLLFAFGRHAPFYRLLYALPYFSSIRNPIKFMHPFQLSLLILFCYGLQGLSRRYLEASGHKLLSLGEQVKAWWARATVFEKRWTLGSLGAAGLSILGMLIYATSRQELERHLAASGFDATQATAIAKFSSGEFGLFVLFLLLSVALVTLMMSGVLAGRRAKWAAILLGLVLVADLARANAPWIKYYNYEEKYVSNPVLDILRDKPYEHRVAVFPFKAGQEMATLQQVYGGEWLQHQFQFYNIQSLDVSQEPRSAPENVAFRTALQTNFVRLWELTNTRFLLGTVGLVDALNQQLDAEKQRFKLHTAFTLSQAPTGSSILAPTNASGPFAVIEFTGALPRARLYSQWQVLTNGPAALGQLKSSSFDPAQSVLVTSTQPVPTPPASPPATAATAEFVSYVPKRVEIKTKSPAPGVLLLNDKYDPDWKVRVDGQPATLLECNYLMRGVALPAGAHTVVFHFEPPTSALYSSLTAIAAGLLMCGYLVFSRRAAGPASVPEPARIPAQPR